MMHKRFPFYISLLIALLTAGCDEVVKSPKLGNKKITPDTFDEITTPPLTSLPTPTLKRPPIKAKMYDAAFYKEVSLSISEHVPVTSLLPALAKSIGVDLQLDPGVETVMFFQATNRPFIEVIEDLCDMGNMRYVIKDKRIRIERDQPYSHTYPIQFLNLTRNSQNRISVATNIFNNGHNSPSTSDVGAVNANMDSNFSGTDSANGSDSQLNVHNHNDFWSELETNLTLIIKNSEDEVVETSVDESKSYSHEATPKSTHLKTAAPQKEGTPLEQKDITDIKKIKGAEVVLKKTKKPTSTKIIKKPKVIAHKPKSHFSIHKQGGLLTVFATQKIQNRVSAYLEQLKIAASSQVLIEAKIIEVTLNHEFKSGINWARLNQKNGLQLQGNFSDMSKNTMHADPTQGAQNLFSIGAKGANFSGILNLLEEFGSAKTLSSPRLTVMNNQAAILKVAQNQVYFRLNYDKQNPNNLTPGGSSVSSTIQTIPIGLIMAVQPSINLETGEVILFLRPTISKFSKIVSDPAVNIAYNANLSAASNDNLPAPSSTVPVVEVREIDSVMKLQDGEIGILGGLMEVSAHEDTDDIPGVSQIPVIKDLFGARNKGEKVVELVILFKVRVEKGGQTSVDAADMRLQDDYIADPRKWKH